MNIRQLLLLRKNFASANVWQLCGCSRQQASTWHPLVALLCILQQLCWNSSFRARMPVSFTPIRRRCQ